MIKSRLINKRQRYSIGDPMPLLGQFILGEQLLGQYIAPWRPGPLKKALQDPNRPISTKRIPLGHEVHGSLRGTYATNYTRQTYGSGLEGRRTKAEITFHLQKGVQVRTKYHVPPLQTNATWIAMKTVLANGVIAWQLMTEDQKKPYRDKEISGKTGSGYNIFMSKYLKTNAP